MDYLRALESVSFLHLGRLGRRLGDANALFSILESISTADLCTALSKLNSFRVQFKIPSIKVRKILCVGIVFTGTKRNVQHRKASRTRVPHALVERELMNGNIDRIGARKL